MFGARASRWRRAARRCRPPRRSTARRGLVGLSVRDAGGGFGAPVRVEQGARLADGIDAAIAASGAAVVAWTETRFDRCRGDQLVARVRAVRRAPGGALGPPQTLSTRRRTSPTRSSGIDGSGRAVVAWRRPAGGRPRGRWIATAAGPGAPFAAPERLGAGEDFIGGVSLAVAPGGGALVVHDTFDGIRVFERSAGRAALHARAASPAGEFDREKPVAALADDGAAAVGWEHDDDELDAVAPEIALRVARRRLPGPAGARHGRARRRAALVRGRRRGRRAAARRRPRRSGDGGLARGARRARRATARRGSRSPPDRCPATGGTSTLFGSPARSAAALDAARGRRPPCSGPTTCPTPRSTSTRSRLGSGRVHAPCPAPRRRRPLPLPALTLSARTQLLRAGRSAVRAGALLRGVRPARRHPHARPALRRPRSATAPRS